MMNLDVEEVKDKKKIVEIDETGNFQEKCKLANKLKKSYNHEENIKEECKKNVRIAEGVNNYDEGGRKEQRGGENGITNDYGNIRKENEKESREWV